jgi:hypothetical protein
VAKATPLSLILLLVAALAPLAFPLLERKLDFEESGPLAGSARPNIRTAPGAEQRLQQAAAAAEALMDASAAGGAHAFFTSLSSELESRGLEVSRLTDWRADWPYGRVRGRRCAALHAVLRAPRGDGKESVAIVTPVALGAAAARRRSLAGQTRDDALLALTAAHALVAGHLRDAAAWLAKDVVWVVPDASCGAGEGVEAWLAAYHRQDEEEEQEEEEESARSSSATAALRRRPFVRAGVIQQALVLQAESSAAPSPAPTASVSLAVVGADGQLPKTDFYLLLRYYCTKWVRLPGCAPPGYPSAAPGSKLDDDDGHSDGPLLRAVAAAARTLGGGDTAANKARAYARRLGLTLRFAGQQARGVPTGPHAPFKWRNTDALTITFHGGASLPPALQRPPLRTRQAAELLELAVRSCSVLIERLHHAFFLYALSSPDHFVSVERYIGPACALIGVMVLQAAGARQRLVATTMMEEEEEEGEGLGVAVPPAASWAASARVAVLLPLLCGALGWGLYAGLEAASLGGLARGGGLAALTATLGREGGGAENPPGYAFAETLRLLSLAAGVAVLAWAGLAEARAALEDGLLLLLRGRAGGGGGDRGKKPSAERDRPTPSSSSSSSSSSIVDWRMVKVLVLCGAAVPLAGMACSNWALAHAVALACAPLAFAEPCGGGGGGASKGRRLGSRARLAAVILCSPLGLAALAGIAAAAVAGPGAVAAAMAAGGGGEHLRWLVLEGTSWAMWSFAWCVYAPVWVASAWIVSLPK